jgi:hypothetical protein
MKEREYGPTVGTPARQCLGPLEEPKEGYGAYGYILFTERPGGEKERAYYEQVCAEYLRQLIPLSEAEARANPNQSGFMPVYWFLTKDGVCNENPQQLVNNYDYDRAISLAHRAIRRIPLGPALLALPKAYDGEGLQEDALLLDLSKFGPDDTRRAFRIWRLRFCSGPGCWNNGFRLEMIREECRKTIIDWSDELMKVVKVN